MESVSVIVPSYNRAPLLPASLTSLFRQTVPVHEVILVDDGSTDDTPAALERFRVEHPEWRDRLRVLRQANHGKPVAVNRGLEIATGVWVGFNDSDDVWLPHKLETQLAVLHRFPESAACVSNTYWDQTNDTLFDQAEENLTEVAALIPDAPELFVRRRHGILMQTALVRREIVHAIGGFDPELRIGQDFDFLFRTSLRTPMCYTKEPLVRLNRDPDDAHRLTAVAPANSEKRLRAHHYMLRQWAPLVPRHAPRLQALLRRKRAENASALANLCLASGRTEEAKAFMREAVAILPSGSRRAKLVLMRCAPQLMSAFRRRPKEIAPTARPSGRRARVAS
ncbi:MAG TPA: glycosyltransferase family A protein [Candidatus Synoicihabitans sp.]|nr:glycosyltransferase family A protein [Candidatus Synoicihabitans sp.]